MAVRREKVVLELEDHLSTGMVKAAGATALLDKSLGDLDGSAVGAEKSLPRVSREIDGLTRSSRRGGPEIDKYSGRLRLMADAAAVLGPSLIPVSAVAVPAITGLASQLGFATLGMGSLVVASQGVGEALKAVNDAALEPTAANLEKASKAMEKLGPDAQAFVARFQELRPVLREIRDQAAAGWFPGLTEALDSFEDIAPRIATIFERIGNAGGNLIADGAAALAGPEWAEFLSFVETNAPQALDDLGRTIGNVVRGLADLWMAFDPLNDDFSTWLLNASRAFAEWSAGLSETQGFADFVEYIRTNGPRVADALAAVANAVIQIVEALAPLGGPSLKIIETFANAIANIADSDLGTPILAGVAALSIYNRALAITAGLQAKVGLGGAAAGAKGGKMAALANAAPLALTAGIGNQVASDVGGKNEIFGVNPFNASPQNALEALINWDPDDFIFTDTVKSIFTGGDKDTSGRNGVQLAFELASRKEVADAARDAAAAERDLADATAELAEEEAASAWAKDTAAAFSSLAADIAKPTLSLKALNQRMRDNARAELNIGDNIRGALANGANPEAIKQAYEELGPAAALAFEELAKGGEKAATRFNAAFGKSTKATEVLEGALADLDRAVGDLRNPTFSVRSARALADIERIKAQLRSVPRAIYTDVFVNYSNGAALQAQGGRDGDPRTPYASGGFTGFGGKWDKAGDVHRGEVVIPAELVSRDRDLLVQRYGQLPGMGALSNGAVQSVRVPSQMGMGAGIDYDRLAAAVSQIRPLYGDVKIQPHNYSEFTRQMDNDRRAAAMGGFGK